MPEIIRTPEEMSDWCEAQRGARKRVGFVPTMGCLHKGHLSLVRIATRVSDVVAVSIFVNPKQFGPNEDFDRYPRVFDEDVAKLRRLSVAAVFAPAPEAMYPDGFDTEIAVGGLTETLCGAHRPGHFNGVTTVVAKLFNIVGRSAAVFGRKDYQQLKVIERLVRDLNLPIEIVPAPIVREPDGLAMSSRNAYLSAGERGRALAFYEGLQRARRRFDEGERRAGVLRNCAAELIAAAADRIDYVEIADPERLTPIDPDAVIEGKALLAAAARIGKTRLIDNTVLGEAW